MSSDAGHGASSPQHYKFIDVAPLVPLSSKSNTVKNTFTYQAPLDMCFKKYEQVQVPFGSRQVSGVVMKMHNNRPPYPTKTINRGSDIVLTSDQVALAQYIAQINRGSLGLTLKLLQPAGKRVSKPSTPTHPKYKTSTAIPKTSAIIIDGNNNRRHRRIQKIITATAKTGGQALIVVPEKWMTSRYQDCVPYHADLKTSEQTSVWHQVRQDSDLVVIGTQKALMLPFRQLRWIILEDDYISTHKLWDQYPRLHNRDLAHKLSDIHHVPVITTGPIASLETTYRVQTGQVITLSNQPLSNPAKIIPFDFEDKLRHYTLPQSFIKQLNRWLKKDQQVLIYYNRREAKRLTKVITSTIPKKASSQVTVATSSIFASHPQKQFHRVIWITPEKDMSYPDYRSHERAIATLARLQQLVLPEVRSRAVSIITRRPDYIEQVLNASPMETHERLLNERRKLHYPPYQDLVQLTITDKKASAAHKKSLKIRQQLNELNQAAGSVSHVKIFGPYQSFENAKHKPAVFQIALTGPIESLVNLYQKVAPDQVELRPAKIL